MPLHTRLLHEPSNQTLKMSQRAPVTEKIKESSLKGPSLLFSYVPLPHFEYFICTRNAEALPSVAPKTDFHDNEQAPILKPPKSCKQFCDTLFSCAAQGTCKGSSNKNACCAKFRSGKKMAVSSYSAVNPKLTAVGL